MVGGVVGLALGEVARLLRGFAVAHVLPWITRRSLAPAPLATWGRLAARGAELIRTMPGGGLAVRFSASGRHLVTASAGMVLVRDTGSGRVVSRFSDSIGAVAISDDIVAIGAAEEVVLREAETGSEVARWRDKDVVTSLAFSADGRFLACTVKGGVRIWDVYQRAELWRNDEDEGVRLRHAAFDSDDRLGIVADTGVQLWKSGLSSWTREPDQPFGINSPELVAFDSAGTRLAIAGYGTVTLWDATSGAKLAHRKTPGSISAMAFHPVARALVFAVSRDVHVWYPDDPSKDTRLHHDWDDVTALDLQRDGSHLVTTCADGTTAIWVWLDDPASWPATHPPTSTD